MPKGKRKPVGPQKPRLKSKPQASQDLQNAGVPKETSAEQPKKTSASKVETGPARIQLRAGRQEKIALALVLAVTFLAFYNSLDGQFVYDDKFQVQKNPTIQSLENIPSMFTQSVWQFMNSTPEQPIGLYYRPLFNVLLILNYQLFGYNVFGWHLVSVLLHMGATLLVYFLAREWGVSREGAAAASLLFGIHPIHSESVSWISGVPDPLAAVLVLLSLLFYYRYKKAEETSQHWLLLSVLLSLLAMFTKEVAIVMPAIILAIEIVDHPPPRKLSELLPRLVRTTWLFAVVAAVYLAMRYQTLGFISKVEPKAAGVTTAQALLTIPSVLIEYGRMILFPFSLAIIYDQPFVTSATSAQFWAAAVAVVAILALAVWLVRTSKAGQKALILFILFLLPVLNLKAFNPEESLLHDRYLYLPSIGFCILIGIGLVSLYERLAPQRAWLVPVGASLIAVVLFGATVFQNQTWQNDVALAQNGLRVSPRKAFLYNLLGAHYSQLKDLRKSEEFYNQALSQNPNYYDALVNQGDIYMQQNKWAEAESAYIKAIAGGATYAKTHYNLGTVYIHLKRFPEAIGALKKAVQLNPSYFEANYNLGYVYQQQGQFSEAEKAYQAALQVNPSYLEPRINLAAILNRQARHQESIEHLEFVRRIAPTHEAMLHTLGEAYLKSRRYEESINTLKQLVARNPKHPYAHTNLGLAYEASGNIEAAKASFQTAVEVAPSEPFTSVAREHLAKLN